MAQEFNPRGEEEIHFSSNVEVTYRSLGIMNAVGGVLDISDTSDLTILPSYISKWIVDHSFQGDQIIAINSESPIGERVTSPLLERTKGELSADEWREAYAKAKITQRQQSAGQIPIDTRAADLLIESEMKTGFSSLSLHFNHGANFLGYFMNRFSNRWLISAYNRETENNSFLEMPMFDMGVDDEERIYLLKSTKKWTDVVLPMIA